MCSFGRLLMWLAPPAHRGKESQPADRPANTEMGQRALQSIHGAPVRGDWTGG